jgi:molybdopterin guanine dinucleotide-containing S/N-oxide reductase-like protein
VNRKRHASNESGLVSSPTEEKSVVLGLSFSGTMGGNATQADYKNGRILRIRPLHYDSKYTVEEIKPWTIKARGQVFKPTMKTLTPPFSLAYKNRVYSPNRILYPLKRVDWDPSGDRNTENRGKSGYVRISWDEALEIIVSELLRIKNKYGTQAVLSQSDGHGETKDVHGPHGCMRYLLHLLGGFTFQTRNPDSWEGWYWGAKHVWGSEPVGQMQPQSNVIPDVAEHADLLLFWGCDPETTPWGFDGQQSSRLCYWFTELGIKSIYICPDLNYGAAIHADKWIPIRPGTDAALQLAIAHIWITQGTYDKEYINTHSVGFDKFSDYVLGKEDGIPKTPKWAAEITGIPSRIIKALAREWASKTTAILHGNGGPGIRSAYSTENGRLEPLLLAMQGLGKPGVHQVKMLEWGLFGGAADKLGRDVSARPLMPGNPGMPRPSVFPDVLSVNQGRRLGKANQIIPKNLIHDALLNPPISWYGSTLLSESAEDQFKKYTYPAEGCSEVHMIWTDTPCWITCWNDSNSYIKGLKSPKIEFILAQHPWMENDCLFADVILPVSTKFELDDIGVDFYSGNFTTIYYEKSGMGHRGESKSDYETVCMIADKMGLLDEYTEGKSVEELIEFAFEHSGVQNMITYEEFKEKGHYVVPTDPEWEKYPPGLRKFYEDPENYRLSTPSGKIEFYSERLATHFPDDKERPPVPHWIERGESHDERLSSDRAKKYPLLVVSNHPKWRVHANHDDMTWLREIPTCKVKGPDGYKYEPLWMNPIDAAKRGIESGDVVRVYNERGSVLGGAIVWERIMPGAVYIDHGARYDPIVPGELDRGGAINTITPHNVTSKNATGMVVSSFLVEAERANLDDLRKKYPQALKRKYHPGAGLPFERVLDGDKSK